MRHNNMVDVPLVKLGSRRGWYTLPREVADEIVLALGPGATPETAELICALITLAHPDMKMAPVDGGTAAVRIRRNK